MVPSGHVSPVGGIYKGFRVEGKRWPQWVPAQVTATSRIKLRPFFLAENTYFTIKQQQQQQQQLSACFGDLSWNQWFGGVAVYRPIPI